MKRALVFLAVVVWLGAPMAFAESVDVVKGDSTWHPFQTPSITGTAYWNNWSLDGNHECNIGYWLSGAGGCSAAGRAVLRGQPTAHARVSRRCDHRLQAHQSAGHGVGDAHHRLEVSAYSPINEVGWFDTNSPTVLNRLFAGTATIGAAATFVPSGSYGFYLKSKEGTYLSTGDGDTRTHFTVFQLTTNGRYIFGLEDMWNGPDWDYNDIVFEVEVSNVPEPASMFLLGGGLAGIRVVRRPPSADAVGGPGDGQRRSRHEGAVATVAGVHGEHILRQSERHGEHILRPIRVFATALAALLCRRRPPSATRWTSCAAMPPGTRSRRPPLPAARSGTTRAWTSTASATSATG